MTFLSVLVPPLQHLVSRRYNGRLLVEHSGVLLHRLHQFFRQDDGFEWFGPTCRLLPEPPHPWHPCSIHLLHAKRTHHLPPIKTLHNLPDYLPCNLQHSDVRVCAFHPFEDQYTKRNSSHHEVLQWGVTLVPFYEHVFFDAPENECIDSMFPDPWHEVLPRHKI